MYDAIAEEPAQVECGVDFYVTTGLFAEFSL